VLPRQKRFLPQLLNDLSQISRNLAQALVLFLRCFGSIPQFIVAAPYFRILLVEEVESLAYELMLLFIEPADSGNHR